MGTLLVTISTKHKIHHISYSYYSQEAFDIVDPNSMQDVFHI